MSDILLNTKDTNFKNFIPVSKLRTSIFSAIFFGITALISILIFKSIPGFSVLLLFFLLYTAISIYLYVCRKEFSLKGNGLTNRIYQFLLDNFMYDGNGTCLEIGSRSGELAIRCALAYPESEFISVDEWKAGWKYDKDLCEANAKIEGVDGRISFLKGNAAKLDFSSDTFDAVISSFKFSTYSNLKDKTPLIRESLRVLKTGGYFCFMDYFNQTSSFERIDDFIKKLDEEGITEIHFLSNIENSIELPAYIKTPGVFKNVGLIYGIK